MTVFIFRTSISFKTGRTALRSLPSSCGSNIFLSSVWIRFYKFFRSGRINGVGPVACVGKRRGAYRVWVGKCEGKRPLGRSVYVCMYVCAWEGNTKLDFQEVGRGACTGLVWLRIRTGFRHF